MCSFSSWVIFHFVYITQLHPFFCWGISLEPGAIQCWEYSMLAHGWHSRGDVGNAEKGKKMSDSRCASRTQTKAMWVQRLEWGGSCWAEVKEPILSSREWYTRLLEYLRKEEKSSETGAEGKVEVEGGGRTACREPCSWLWGPMFVPLPSHQLILQDGISFFIYKSLNGWQLLKGSSIQLWNYIWLFHVLYSE